jgi:hypothetical protein
MAETERGLTLGLEDDGRRVAMTPGGTVADGMAALLAAAPTLAEPSHAAALALAANHFAGGEFSVILDPASFAAAYRARLDGEDPTVPWQDSVIRLRDFGVPDFAAITVPQFRDGTLVYFATDDITFLPYRAEAAAPAFAAVYAPMALRHLPSGITLPAAVPLRIVPTPPEPEQDVPMGETPDTA